MTTTANVLSKLKGIKKVASGYTALCPGHDDKANSLKIAEADGKILLHCFAGCSAEKIVSALGLQMTDLFLDKPAPKPTIPRQIVATYDYHDEQGTVLFQAVRFEPKDFSQRHKNGNGEWLWNLEGVRRVIYHLPDILACTNETIYLVEGEKDADNLWKWGKPATTSPLGANAWKSEYAEYFKGLKVCIIPDKDQAGIAYAKAAAKSLQGKARETKVIMLPGEGKDISDWLEAGGDVADLESMESPVSVLEMPVGVTITRTITGYIFRWAGLTVTTKRVEVHKDGRVTGEMTIETPTTKLVPATQFNFSASRTRKELANDLKAKNTDFDWEEIINLLCNEIQERAKTGEPGQIIEATDEEASPPTYFIEPLVMQGVPSILYGDKGCRKTTLCIAAIGMMALGWQDNPLGFSVDPHHHSIAFLDWESNWDLTRLNVLKIRKGMGFPYFKFAYRPCRFALADDVEAIQVFLEQNHADVIVIDSLGAACGGDLFKPEPALKFFSALKALPAQTSLIIAQNAKGEEGKKTIYGSAYFSYYARNIFELKKSETHSETEITLGLFHREGNYSRKYKPVGFRVTDDDRSIHFEVQELTASQFSDRVKATLRLRDFLITGAKPVSLIAKYLDVTENYCRLLLSREKEKGHVINTSPGIWELVERELPHEE